MDTILVPNTAASLKTYAAETHLAEGQFLREEQILNIEKSLSYTEKELEDQGFQNRTGFRTKVNLNKEQCIKVIRPFI
jgi:hypothetical protein